MRLPSIIANGQQTRLFEGRPTYYSTVYTDGWRICWVGYYEHISSIFAGVDVVWSDGARKMYGLNEAGDGIALGNAPKNPMVYLPPKHLKHWDQNENNL